MTWLIATLRRLRNGILGREKGPKHQTQPGRQPGSKKFSIVSTEGSERLAGKRLVVACDGTWQNSDAGYDTSITGTKTAQIPSNVTRIVRAISHTSRTNIPQISYYQRGVGTNGDFEDKWVGGITGNDITEHIREAYAFICNNFYPWTQDDMTDATKPWDEIVLLGFSRGAFTARAISSLISDVGLLTRTGMEEFWGIFEDWKNQGVEGKEGKWFEKRFGKKGVGFTTDEYKNTLKDNNLTRCGMPISAVGVWDTVGALGIPLSWTEEVQQYSFVNQKVAQSVQYAFQALALDEHRGLFTPTVWEEPEKPHSLKLLKQCWFPGVHGNCGGGYSDAGMSNITLAWMISQLQEHGILDFDVDYEDFVQELNKKFYEKVPVPRSWGLGRVFNSTSGLEGSIENMGSPPKVRTPGRYCQVSSVDGKQTNIPLVNTGECIHRCVRVRIAEGGLGEEADPTTLTATEKLEGKVESFMGVKKPPEKYETQAFDGKLAPLKGFIMEQPPAGVKVEMDYAALGNSGFLWVNGEVKLPEDEFLPTERNFYEKCVPFN